MIGALRTSKSLYPHLQIWRPEFGYDRPLRGARDNKPSPIAAPKSEPRGSRRWPLPCSR